MNRFFVSATLTLWVLGTASLHASGRSVTVEIELGKPFPLSSVGGPDMMLTIDSETTSAIRYTVVDPRQMRQVIRYDYRGYPYTEMVPLATPQSVSKSNGISVSGTLSKLYPLYSDSSLTVYFYDTLATRQNHRKLVIRYPSTQQTE